MTAFCPPKPKLKHIARSHFAFLTLVTIFPQQVAVSSSKGATGHTLGASGAINTALTLMAMKHNYLPPCIGLKNLEFDLNTVTRARKAKCDRAMCFSFGFGGQNAVITLSK